MEHHITLIELLTLQFYFSAPILLVSALALGTLLRLYFKFPWKTVIASFFTLIILTIPLIIITGFAMNNSLNLWLGFLYPPAFLSSCISFSLMFAIAIFIQRSKL